jgi:23S rRNA pseudouridine1911/1915/1917 synthase
MSNPVFVATAAEQGAFLVLFLAKRLGCSRKRAKQILDQRCVFVNRKRVWMARHELHRGDEVEVAATETPPVSPRSPAVIHRSAGYVAVNKPAGVLSNGPDSLEMLLRVQLDEPSLVAVHRLDRHTSGAILYATNAAALDDMVGLFRRQEVAKTYHAIVAGRIVQRDIEISAPLDGQTAFTRVSVLRTAATASHVRLRIDTGRTHQIRRHMASIRHPVLGDRTYFTGEQSDPLLRGIPRQMLHASCLSYRHPKTGQTIRIEAPFPPDYRAVLRRLGLS